MCGCQRVMPAHKRRVTCLLQFMCRFVVAVNVAVKATACGPHTCEGDCESGCWGIHGDTRDQVIQDTKDFEHAGKKPPLCFSERTRMWLHLSRFVAPVRCEWRLHTKDCHAHRELSINPLCCASIRYTRACGPHLLRPLRVQCVSVWCVLRAANTSSTCKV